MAIDGVVNSEVVVVGTGIAGLAAALGCAPRRVTVLTKSPAGIGGSSRWAQGGIAAAVAPEDSPALHAADTLAAGAGLNDPRVVSLLTAEGPERIGQLLELGADFDRDADGGLSLGREAAHSRRRILHAHGDATGAEIVRTLLAAVREAPEIQVIEGAFAVDLWSDPRQGDRVSGVVAVHRDGRRLLYRAPAVVLATGGLGQLYLHTTNPVEATGDGLAMAWRAGAQVVDVEFVQFHPTALNLPGLDPLPLLTEALRGEGATLIDGSGDRFMSGEHPDRELAPRDVVARAIWRRMAAGERLFLDATRAVGDRFPERFPTVYASCRVHGIDPRVEPVPVAPAAHYHMGGIAVDGAGRSSLPGLWACGEVAATGAHGANRLASNSLLEALVFGAKVAEDLRSCEPQRLAGAGIGRPPAVSGEGDPMLTAGLRRLMWEKVGVERDGQGLAAALESMDELAERYRGAEGESRNLLAVGRLVAGAALLREESRGSHCRIDFPESRPEWQHRLYLTAAPDGSIQIAEEPRRIAGALG